MGIVTATRGAGIEQLARDIGIENFAGIVILDLVQAALAAAVA